jgi:hypothetical protein
MSTVSITGVLALPNSLPDPEYPLAEVKEIVLTVIDDDDIQKLENIRHQYRNYKLPLFKSGREYKLTLRLQSINGKFGSLMLDKARPEWTNQRFTARFKLKAYQFVSKLASNKGEIIRGFTFNIESIDLLI